MSRIGRGMDYWPPGVPRPVESGNIHLLQDAPNLASGIFQSVYRVMSSGAGVVSISGAPWPIFPAYCAYCKQLIGSLVSSGLPMVTVPINEDHSTLNYHKECVGFDWNKYRGFETREHWIKESMGFALDTPCGIVADKCEEQGRWVDAEWLRGNRSGK